MKAKESGSPKNRNTSKFLQILRSGDVRAFERFYVDNYALIRDYLTKWNIRYEEAEEIAQDVMITVWDMRDNFFGVDDKQLFKYIYITAKSMAMKLEKTKQKQLELTTFLRFNPNHTFESPEETFIINEQIESIYKIINHMPPIRRRVFEMKFNEGYSNEKIAQELNISQATVRSHTRHIFQDITLES